MGGFAAQQENILRLAALISFYSLPSYLLAANCKIRVGIDCVVFFGSCAEYGKIIAL